MIRSLAQIAADNALKNAGQAHAAMPEATPASPQDAGQVHTSSDARPSEKQARRTHGAARTHADTQPAPKKRGRPTLGDRPMTQSEMNARSRAKKRARMQGE
jgi:hypothetical protein